MKIVKAMLVILLVCMSIWLSHGYVSKQLIIRHAKQRGIDTYYLEDWCSMSWDNACDNAFQTVKDFTKAADLHPDSEGGDREGDPIWWPDHLSYSPEPLRFPYKYPGHWECPPGLEQHEQNGSYFGAAARWTDGEGSGSTDKSHPPTCQVPTWRRKP